MYLIDLGDAMVETKQQAPGSKPDSVFVFGRIAGSPGEDGDIERLMLVRDAVPE
jgi:hypothetical protein